MNRITAAIASVMVMSLHGCATVQTSDTNRAAVYFDNCKSLAGTYCDDKDYYARFTVSSRGMSQWQFLTLEPDISAVPSQLDVSISKFRGFHSDQSDL